MNPVFKSVEELRVLTETEIVQTAGVNDFLKAQLSSPQSAHFTLVLLAVRCAVFGEGFENNPKTMPEGAPEPRELIEPNWVLADKLSRSLAKEHPQATFDDLIVFLTKSLEEDAIVDAIPADQQTYFRRWCQGFCLEMLATHEPMPEYLNRHLNEPQKLEAFLTILENFATRDAVLPSDWPRTTVPKNTPDNKAIFDSQIASYPDNYAKICATAICQNIKQHYRIQANDSLVPTWQGVRASSTLELVVAYQIFLPSMNVLSELAGKFIASVNN